MTTDACRAFLLARGYKLDGRGFDAWPDPKVDMTAGDQAMIEIRRAWPGAWKDRAHMAAFAAALVRVATDYAQVKTEATE